MNADEGGSLPSASDERVPGFGFGKFAAPGGFTNTFTLPRNSRGPSARRFVVGIALVLPAHSQMIRPEEVKKIQFETQLAIVKAN